MVGSDEPRDSKLIVKALSELVRDREESADRSERAQIRQSRVESWKTSYDFQKHMMTISLTAIGGFAALVGSVFDDPNAWSTDPWTPPRTAVIIAVFVGFLGLFFSSYIASGVARRNVARVPNHQKDDQLPEYYWWKISVLMAELALGFGLLGFVVFVFLSFPNGISSYIPKGALILGLVVLAWVAVRNLRLLLAPRQNEQKKQRL